MTHPLHAEDHKLDPFELATEDYKRLILSLLDTTEEQVCCDWKVFDEEDLDPDDEEGWSTPAGLINLLNLEDVSTPNFSHGHVELLLYKGRRVLVEQNASPLIIYYAK